MQADHVCAVAHPDAGAVAFHASTSLEVAVRTDSAGSTRTVGGERTPHAMRLARGPIAL